MTYWFLPEALTATAEARSLANSEFEFSATGLPDLRKALWPEQLEAWIQKVNPDLAPDKVNVRASHYWRLVHDILPSDFIVIQDGTGQALMVGELIDSYKYEDRAEGCIHGFPVSWMETRLSLSEIPGVESLLIQTQVSIITDEELLARLQSRMPSRHPRGYKFMRWLTLATLIGEFFYFWPR